MKGCMDGKRTKEESAKEEKRDMQGFYGCGAGGNGREPGVAGDGFERAIIAPSACSVSATEPALSLLRPSFSLAFLYFLSIRRPNLGLYH